MLDRIERTEQRAADVAAEMGDRLSAVGYRLLVRHNLRQSRQDKMNHRRRCRFAGRAGDADGALPIEPLNQQANFGCDRNSGTLRSKQVFVLPRLRHGRVGDHKIAM